jgi:GntR family transcriptional regulator
MKIERTSPQPLYSQVERMLIEKIGREYKAGQLLPTQKQLAQETGVSLITVKRALTEMSRQGLIEATRGRGTTVRRPSVSDDRFGVGSWTDTIAGHGGTPGTAWVRFEIRTPPKEEASILQLKAREKTVLIRRLRTIDGEPICLMSNELPLAMVPDLHKKGMSEQSLYGCLLKKYGLRPGKADEEVAARVASKYEREVLGPDTKIVLVVRRYSFLRDGQPMEIGEIVSPAHRYNYRVQIFAPDGKR